MCRDFLDAFAFFQKTGPEFRIAVRTVDGKMSSIRGCQYKVPNGIGTRYSLAAVNVVDRHLKRVRDSIDRTRRNTQGFDFCLQTVNIQELLGYGLPAINQVHLPFVVGFPHRHAH